MADDLERLVQAVRQSPRHGRIAEDVIRRVGADELPKRKSLKEAVKATKNKLHQIGGAYLEGGVDYARWLARLRDAAADPDPDAVRGACRDVMRRHASTAERLPILEEFFAATLAEIAPVESVIDLACGLNPLAIPWMPLAPGARYHAYDMYHDMMAFLESFFDAMGVDGRAAVGDVAGGAPPVRAQVAFILKTIPCLEQIDKAAGARLLGTAQADWLLVSFPVRSLGGRDKGMVDTYDAHMAALLAAYAWPARRFEFETELAFLIDRRGGDVGAA